MQCKSSRSDQHLLSADLQSIPSISGREDAPRFYTDPVNRRVYMDHVSFFVYLTDVEEGDGGVRHCATRRLSPAIHPTRGFCANAVQTMPAQRQRSGLRSHGARALLCAALRCARLAPLLLQVPQQ